MFNLLKSAPASFITALMTASSLGAPHPAYVFPSKSITELMFALFKETNPEVLCWIIVAIVLIGSGSSLVRAYVTSSW